MGEVADEDREAKARPVVLLRHDRLLWRNGVICPMSQHSNLPVLELNAKLESPIGEQYSGPGSCTFYMSILTQMSSPGRTHQVMMLWLTNFWLTSSATELICDPGEAK